MHTDYMPTKIDIIIDKSGSMGSRKQQIVQGYNQFIQKQRILGGECTVSTFFFSDEITVLFENQPISDTRDLARHEYEPDGMTALRDALGHVYERILNDDDHDTRRIVFILTDGMENASQRVSPERLQELRHQVSTKAEIIYMGSNQDAIAVGENIGAPRGSSLNYDDDLLLDAMDSIGRALTRARTEGTAVEFTDVERLRSSGETVRL